MVHEKSSTAKLFPILQMTALDGISFQLSGKAIKKQVGAANLPAAPVGSRLINPKIIASFMINETDKLLTRFVRWTGQDFTQTLITKHYPELETKLNPTAKALLYGTAGALGGTVAEMGLYPLEVIRNQLQQGGPVNLGRILPSSGAAFMHKSLASISFLSTYKLSLAYLSNDTKKPTGLEDAAAIALATTASIVASNPATVIKSEQQLLGKNCFFNTAKDIYLQNGFFKGLLRKGLGWRMLAKFPGIFGSYLIYQEAQKQLLLNTGTTMQIK